MGDEWGTSVSNSLRSTIAFTHWDLGKIAAILQVIWVFKCILPVEKRFFFLFIFPWNVFIRKELTIHILISSLATCHYQKQCLPIAMVLYGLTVQATGGYMGRDSLNAIQYICILCNNIKQQWEVIGTETSRNWWHVGDHAMDSVSIPG